MRAHSISAPRSFIPKSSISSTDNNSVSFANKNNPLIYAESPNFSEELKILMTGFGDNEFPDPESIELLQEYVIEYIQNVSILAYKKSKRKGNNEIQLKDLLSVIKRDKKQLYRVPNLLKFLDETKKLKKKLTNRFDKKNGDFEDFDNDYNSNDFKEK